MDDDAWPAEWLAQVEAGLSPSQHAFLAAWHRRTQTWPYDARGNIRPVEEHNGHLVVYADLVETTHSRSLLTIAAHVAETTVRCDHVHSQLLTLPDAPTADALMATGSPEDLADRSADWFENILRRRVVCHEWRLQAGRAIRDWRFTDTGETLTAQYPRQSRPPDAIYDVRTEWS